MRMGLAVRVLVAMGAVLVALAACGKKEEAPAEVAAPSTALEGQLDIVAWPGYITRSSVFTSAGSLRRVK